MISILKIKHIFGMSLIFVSKTIRIEEEIILTINILYDVKTTKV